MDLLLVISALIMCISDGVLAWSVIESRRPASETVGGLTVVFYLVPGVLGSWTSWFLGLLYVKLDKSRTVGEHNAILVVIGLHAVGLVALGRFSSLKLSWAEQLELIVLSAAVLLLCGLLWNKGSLDRSRGAERG